MTQGDLFTQDDPDYMQGELGQAFKAHHEAHPWLYDALVRLAQEWAQTAPGRRCGAKMLWENLRWRVLTSDDYALLDHTPALNNSWVSRYVRMMLDDPPEWDCMFETRALRAA